MKKILMISYYYPPIADVGSLRTLGFSKYLPAFGWEPYVLSVKNPDKSYCTIGSENPPENVKTFYIRSLFNLYKIIGKANGLIAKILRLFAMELNGNIIQDLFCIPDIFIGWMPLTLIKGLRIMKKDKIDVIYVSCQPFSAAVTGTILKKITKKPLILDFRDPVSFPLLQGVNDILCSSNPLKDSLVRRLEEYTLKVADRFIVVTDGIRDKYLSLYPFLKSKIATISNGFFYEHLPNEKPRQFNNFTITYSGNFYADMGDPHIFFKALKTAVSKNKGIEEKTQFLYLGNRNERIEEIVRRYRLDNTVTFLGWLPRREAIKTLYSSSIILVRIMPLAMGTKIFEALACGKPILVLLSEGEAAEIIRKYCSRSYLITSNNPEDISCAIIDAYRKWESGTLNQAPNQEFLDRFNRRALTQELAEILDNISI